MEVSSPKYADGTITFEVNCDASSKEYAQRIPANFVKNLFESDLFSEASYKGYTIKTVKVEGKEEAQDRITFSSSVKLVGNKSAYHPAESSEEEK